MDENILRRIKKLLAIAEDHRADPNEAAAAAGMAAKIMAKYQLDHQDLIIESIKNDLDTQTFVGAARKNKKYFARVPGWIDILAVQVARLNSVEVVKSVDDQGRACVKFYGYKDDTLLASWTMTYLVGTVNALCRAFRGNGMESGISYRRGVSSGICDSIKALLVEQETQKETSNALVVAKKAAIEQEFGNFSYSLVHQKISDPYASSQGYIDGKKVDLNVRGITGDTEVLKLAN